MPLDIGYDDLSSRVELQSAIVTLLRMAGEHVDAFNRRAEKEGCAVIRKGKLERFTRKVEMLR